VQRDYHVDPDRIYLTGHSMGGHMTWRSAFQFPDRFAAVSPMSGGYDYVKSKDVTNLVNVPGYTTFGTDEPYQINAFNQTIARGCASTATRGLPGEAGRHTIYGDEVPKVAEFFAKHPRDLYRQAVFARLGAQPLAFDTAEKNAAWGKEHQWNPARKIVASTVHWLRGFAREAEAPPEQRVMTVAAAVSGNRFTVASENARRLRLYLHPRMVDFRQPVVVVANGKPCSTARSPRRRDDAAARARVRRPRPRVLDGDRRRDPRRSGARRAVRRAVTVVRTQRCGATEFLESEGAVASGVRVRRPSRVPQPAAFGR